MEYILNAYWKQEAFRYTISGIIVKFKVIPSKGL